MNTSAVKNLRARKVDFSASYLTVYLQDGRAISVPLQWFPRLRRASSAERKKWKLIGRGIGVRWEALDEDVSVLGLLAPNGLSRIRKRTPRA